MSETISGGIGGQSIQIIVGVGEAADTAAGLAATDEGELFWVDQGDGTGKVYRHDAGPVATELRSFAIDGESVAVAAQNVHLPDQSIFPGSIAVGNMIENIEHTVEPGDREDEGGYNTYFGLKALAGHGGAGTGLTNQWANTGVGYGACNYYEQSTDAEAGTSMFGNTAVGFLAMPVLRAAYDNTAVGARALEKFRNGNDNSAFGIKSMWDFVDGSDNSAFGYGTLESLDSDAAGATSNRNVAVGAQAGRYLNDQVTKLLQADDCIFIGSMAYAGQDETSNEIVIGADARGGGPNTVTIGNESTVANRLYGNLVVSGHLNLRGGTFRQLIFERNAVGTWSIGNPTESGTGNSFAFVLNDSLILHIDGGVLQPGPDNTYDLGGSGARFKDIYGTTLRASTEVRVGGTKVLGTQGAAVADATDAASAITQLNALLARCRAHGLIAP